MPETLLSSLQGVNVRYARNECAATAARAHVVGLAHPIDPLPQPTVIVGHPLVSLLQPNPALSQVRT